MNGKKAKKLRAIARSKTVGMPEVSYKEVNHHKKQCGTFTNDHGVTLPFMVVVSQRVLGNCTRKLYQSMK